MILWYRLRTKEGFDRVLVDVFGDELKLCSLYKMPNKWAWLIYGRETEGHFKTMKSAVEWLVFNVEP